MPIPEAGTFNLHQEGWYVCRTMFNYMDENGIHKQSLQTGNQLKDQDYLGIDPGDLGVPDGSAVQYYLWVMASANDQISDQSFAYRKGSQNVATFTCSGPTVGPVLTYDGLKSVGSTSNRVTPEQLRVAATVGNSICEAVSASHERGDQNPVLLALAADPMQVMIQYGLPTDFLAGALTNVKDDFLAFLKAQAASELAILQKRQVPRGFFRCWACRIGFGAVVALVGAVISAVTVGAGGAIFVAAVNFMVTWGVAMVVAEGAMVAATAVGGVSLAGGIAALIEFICEKIPETC